MKQNPKRSAPARRFNTVLIVWLCLTFFFLLFPILGIAIMSFNSSKYGALPFDFTTKWYAELFRSADLISATWYSLWFSLLVSLCAAVLGIMASLALRRMSRKWNRAFPTLMNVPVIIPWLVQAVALLLLFFILAAQFESLVQPWIILSEIVIDLFGALIVLWFFGVSLNLMSMIGLIVVCGIVINDSILKIDTINTLRRQGVSLKHAILEAGQRRLKAIVMTSLTTILAVLPFLARGDMGSDLQFPMSLVIISGMTVGTLVSVFFIPLAYYEIYKPRR